MERRIITLLLLFFLLGCEENDFDDFSMDAGDLAAARSVEPSCVRYVDFEAEDEGDGLSWETAFIGLQLAIDAAATETEKEEHCEVWVKGDNKEELSSSSPSHRDNVDVFSGFVGDERSRPAMVSSLFPLSASKRTAASNDDLGSSPEQPPLTLPAPTEIDDFGLSVPEGSVTPYIACGSCTGTGTIDGTLHIGTSSNKNGHLNIYGFGNSHFNWGTYHNNYMSIGDSASSRHYYRVGNSSPFAAWTSAGRLGIGTTNPSAKLDILDDGDDDFTGIEIEANQESVSTENWKGINFKGPFQGAFTVCTNGVCDDRYYGNNVSLLNASDYNHFIWALPWRDEYDAYDWGIYWAGDEDARWYSGDRQSNPNEIVFVGYGEYKASISLHSGNAHFAHLYTEGVTVKTSYRWPDYVFEKDYSLMSLDEVEKYIDEHKRLPDIPSSQHVEENGIEIAENQANLLKKIEELTLYIIEQNKKIGNLEAQNSRLEAIEDRINSLENGLPI